MTLDSALYGLVTADAGITNLISTKFYPATMPQTVDKPYCVYQRISTPRRYIQTGQSTLTWPRYQLTMVADDFDEARSIADAFRALLSGYSGTTGGVAIRALFLDNERDEFADAIDEYIVRQDYIIWHTET